MKKKETTIWVGTVEDIFGYGISVIGNSKKQCKDVIEKTYNKWVEGRGDSDDYAQEFKPNGEEMTRFEKAMEQWGMDIREVEIGKGYYDNFGG